MVRGIPHRTGKVDEVLVDCELYGLCRYVIESFPWVFMLPNETEESVPLANALVVALFLLQRSCDDVLQRIRRKKAIAIGDEESRSTWFDDLIELVKWPFYRPDDREFPVEVWRKGTILTLRDNYNSGIYLSLYPRMDCLRGTLMTQHLNQVIEQSSTLRKKFTRGIIAREVFKILGLTKPGFAVDHGSLAIRSPGVENGQLKPDVWKVGVKQRDIILNATKSKRGSVGNTSVDSLDSSNQSMGPIR